jgi:hypothetical protein
MDGRTLLLWSVSAFKFLSVGLRLLTGRLVFMELVSTSSSMKLTSSNANL